MTFHEQTFVNGFRESSKDGYYYFDIETTGLEPAESKIVSIQYQHLSYTSGRPFIDARLEIMKEWESDERMILEKFRKFFIESKGSWYFIPVGNNLDFEFRFIEYKLEQYFGQKASLEFLRDRKKVDLADICVMMNGLKFTDCTSILGKSHEAENMKQWYVSNDYTRIEAYIKKEANDFVNSFSIIYAEMPKLKNILKHFSSNHTNKKINYNITSMNN
jgi:RNase_H superfamily